VCLCPGAAVEVCCDGAWSQGVVRRVVREDFEYEVSVDGEKAEQLLTKAVYQLRPLYMWNGKRWTHGQQASLSATPPSAQVTDTLAVNVPDTLPAGESAEDMPTSPPSTRIRTLSPALKKVRTRASPSQVRNLKPLLREFLFDSNNYLQVIKHIS